MSLRKSQLVQWEVLGQIISMEQSHTEQKSCSLILGPSYYAQSLVRYYPWVACPRFECCSQSQRHCGWSCCCSVTQLWPAFETPWTAACQTSLSFTLSLTLLKLMSIESVMPSNHPLSSPSPPALNLAQH